MSWSGKHGCPEPVSWWMNKDDMPPFTEEERRRYAEEREKERQDLKESLKKKRGDAAKIARAKWKAATPVGPALFKEGSYLKKKKLARPWGAKQLGDNLIIPVYSPAGELVSTQEIYPNGEKRFQPGGLTTGCFCVIGEEEAGRGRYVFVAEGWATAAAIHEATGCQVVAAWYVHNLASVVETMLRRYPSKLVLAADNDHKTAGNPGEAEAFKVAEKWDIPLAIPEFDADKGEKGTDWNDYMVIHDVEETSRALFAAVEEWEKDVIAHYWQRGPVWVEVKENGNPKNTIENLEAMLRCQGIRASYNEVAKDASLDIPGTRYCEDGRAEAEVDYILSLCGKFGYPDKHLTNFLSNIAMKNSHNPVRDWIRSKPWDGTDRVEALCGTLSTPRRFPEDFKNLILRRWLVSAVAAMFSKGGFHNRGVLTLQGEQSLGKTSWFGALVPKDSQWFTSLTNLDPKDRDSVKPAVSYWISEMAELDGILKKIDMARLKAFLTLQSDELRLPYGRKYSKFARRTVFCASVNENEFLRDSTGNSRWWVIPCVGIDYKHDIDLQQLWAQVYTWYSSGERWYFDKEEEEELKSSNWEFEQVDEVEDLIRSRFDWENYEVDIELNYAREMTATEALRLCKVDRPDRGQATRAGQVLRTLTKHGPRRSHSGRLYLLPRPREGP
jgi:putative DNA primase/helicase